MNENEFLKKLLDAYNNAGGDLWKFWALMNPDAPRNERSTRPRVVKLYCNQRKNKDGTVWIKRNGKLDNVLFEFEFRTATVPKYHGFIEILDYILSESEKKIIVYKFEFMSSENAKNGILSPEK